MWPLTNNTKEENGMTIIVVSEYGTLVDEKTYDTENATEAVKMYMAEDPVLEEGDRIQIRR